MEFQNTSPELSRAWSKLYGQALQQNPTLTSHEFSRQLKQEVVDGATAQGIDPEAVAAAGQAALSKPHIKVGG